MIRQLVRRQQDIYRGVNLRKLCRNVVRVEEKQKECWILTLLKCERNSLQAGVLLATAFSDILHFGVPQMLRCLRLLSCLTKEC